MCYLYPDCDNILWLCIVTRCNRDPEICRNNVVQSVIKTSQILGHKLTFTLTCWFAATRSFSSLGR